MTQPSDVLTLKVPGPRLDAAAAPSFRQTIEQTLNGQNRVLLDLGEVEFLDSTGLGVLVAMLKRMGSDGRIAVIGAAPSVARLFQITRLNTLFLLRDSEAEARDVLAA